MPIPVVLLPLSAGLINIMKKLLTVVLLAIIAITQSAWSQISSDPIALLHVSVVDVRSGETKPDMTVLVWKNRIIQIGSSKTVHVPKNARTIDARAKYLIPGLWDMHVHSLWDANRPPLFFPLFLANGLYRGAESCLLRHSRGSAERWNSFCRSRSARNRSGRSVEHLMGILLYSSWKSDELKADLRKGTNINQINSQLVDTYDPSRAAVLYALFVKNNTWQVPTLTIRHARPYLQELQASNDPRLKYMPSTIVESWGPHVDQRQPASPEVIASRKRLFQKELEVVASMHRAGVKLFAGTDTPNPYCFPGFSLHDELGFMVQAGLPPLEALQTATINPAEFLGLSKILGTLEKGKIADLVLLDANPLEDIANTKRIMAVVSSGRLLDRKALDDLLTGVADRVAPGSAH